MALDAGAPALWLAVLALGAWHGLNPAMGWPLAVAHALGERRASAVWATFLPLGSGHFLAMAAVLLPFTLLGLVAAWNRPVRLGAALVVLLFGLARLVWRRHPRALARIRPTQLVLWSFVIASAHGAGLMLLPFALGLCAPGHTLSAGGGLGGALLVAAAHTAAMLAAGLAAAWLVLRVFGLGALRRGWLDLELAWAASLVLTGAASAWMVW